MNKEIVSNMIKRISDRLNDEAKESELELLKKNNQALQDFVIWLRGYLDGDDLKTV